MDTTLTTARLPRHGTSTDTLVGRLRAGAAAGTAATLPMTGLMLALGSLPARQGAAPFPPRLVMAAVAGRLGLWQRASPAQRHALTWAGHLGYGAATGALYHLGASRSSVSPTVRGARYGLLLWAASYAGWLPALGIMRPPWRERPGRTLQMIAAHLVWGACLGWLSGR